MINKVKYMHKRLIPILVVMGLSFFCIAVSFAEEHKTGGSIFEYKKELSLTDDQEKNLHDIISKLQNSLAGSSRELGELRAELNKMIADKADLYKIKAKLRAIAQIQADASYEDIASSRAIETELTATQLSMWHGIQEDFRKNQQQAQDNAAAKQKGAAQ